MNSSERLRLPILQAISDLQNGAYAMATGGMLALRQRIRAEQRGGPSEYIEQSQACQLEVAPTFLVAALLYQNASSSWCPRGHDPTREFKVAFDRELDSLHDAGNIAVDEIWHVPDIELARDDGIQVCTLARDCRSRTEFRSVWGGQPARTDEEGDVFISLVVFPHSSLADPQFVEAVRLHIMNFLELGHAYELVAKRDIYDVAKRLRWFRGQCLMQDRWHTDLPLRGYRITKQGVAVLASGSLAEPEQEVPPEAPNSWAPPPGYVSVSEIMTLEEFQKKGKNPTRPTIQRWEERHRKEAGTSVGVQAPDTHETHYPRWLARDWIKRWNPR